MDLGKIVTQKDEVVLSFRLGRQRSVDERKNLRLYRGHARFVAPHRLQIGDETIESEKIFINTGGRASIPEIPGLPNVPFLTNESMLRLTELPEHLVILGGGYIGLEFGQMFRRYGSRVTIVHRGPQIVPREDAEIAAELQKALEAEGLEFVLNAHPEAANRKGDAITLAVSVKVAPPNYETCI